MSEGTKKHMTKRSILSQVLACLAQDLLLLDLGMAISFATIITPALLNAEGELSFTKQQVSWFGSVSLIVQPIGSMLSGALLQSLGRKRSLLLVNIPNAAAWLTMYFANSVTMIFVGNVLLGLGTGFMEAPLLTYIGEVTHPDIRGRLSSLCQFFGAFGVFGTYLLGTIVDWRTAALICLVVPILTALVTLMIPETPVWLLMKGRSEEAMDALCWLRGWTTPDQVQEEFDEIMAYQQTSVQCHLCDVNAGSCVHENCSKFDRVKYTYLKLTRKEILKPLIVITSMFIFMITTVNYPIRPTMINLYKCFGFTIDPYWSNVLFSLASIFAQVFLMFVMPKFGKRILVLVSLVLCAAFSFLIGIYAFIVIPEGMSSFKTAPELTYDTAWIPMTLFTLLNFCASFGITVIPWVMLCEIYPLSGRGIACGFTAAFTYISGSISIKLYYNLETTFGIHGIFWYYAAWNLFGLVVLYLILPETEGKSLAAIEEHFKHKFIVPGNTYGISRRKKMDIEINSIE